ncbi:Copper chaperone CopZ [uncultured Paludibacter sp.]|uniref:Copper chaperone CopZ n=1 Tax=uncultured Paludibacter sp. TaxID=497635 RepID=A0A653AGC1_9BACT|nr:Copper chaperone CopZ [uncultured Paludibacter sp.]
MEKTLKIKGMSCSHCAMRVEKALNKIDGVEAKVDLENHIAKVKLSKPVADNEYYKALDDSGYEITEIQ